MRQARWPPMAAPALTGTLQTVEALSSKQSTFHLLRSIANCRSETLLAKNGIKTLATIQLRLALTSQSDLSSQMLCKQSPFHLSCHTCRESMNNSELSIMTSSDNAFTALEAYVYPPSWDNLPNEGSQSNTLFRNGNCDNRVTGVECVEATSSHGGRATHTVKVRPWSEARQPDLGLWLLHSSTNRHDQWGRLLRLFPGGFRARHFGLQYSSTLV